MLFRDMMRDNVRPNCYTLPVVLKSCCKLIALRDGEEVHCIAFKNGFISNTYVGTNLIELYSDGGHVSYAYRAFAEMVDRNVVSWTAIITGYVSNELGDMMEAKRLCDMMPCKDLMSYNTLLNGYAKNGDHMLVVGRVLVVLDAFNRMLKETDVWPNDATLVNVLSSCARLGVLDFGKRVHKYADNNGYKWNVCVCNGLIDMYAKCGLVECAIDVFESMTKKDLISWNTIINALAVHGHGADALSIFAKMKNAGEKPDGITFIGILCACSHMRLAEDGLVYFQSMTDEYSIQPKIEHYGCVVNLLARGGAKEGF
ncbi:hypothetical protein C2S52_013063 [Perilla frutescens var. hirtella]|nr:hypothetical protein C2S52_013063 [Perilla frutescens var. hirtella]